MVDPWYRNLLKSFGGLAAVRRMWNFGMTGAVQIAPWHGPRDFLRRSVEVPRTHRPGGRLEEKATTG